MSLSNRVRLCLSEWISFLLLAVPIRSRASFIELLCGCMVSPEGWVTRAISAIARRRHWTTYYKLLGRGSLRTVRLARRLFLLVLTVLPCDVLTLVIDDTLVPRSSEQAPGCAYRHDHSRKINRPQFMRAQCWVTLGVSALGNGGVNLVLPILSRLVPNTGNRNKLKIALVLVRSLAGVANKPVRVLFDSWFMRARLVLPLLRRQMHVIGQARIDTALFLVPPPPTTPRRGRKRIYGERLNAEAIEALPAIELRMPLYGKDQQVRLRSAEARARFLKGALVRAVWCQFFDAKKQVWTKPRLLLASETDLSAQEIVQLYARRWGIEPLFHNLKRWFGMSNLWQQSRTVLELWMQIRSMAWTLNQLLSLALVETFPMDSVAPWRVNQLVTAGLVMQWLRMEFTGLAFRDGLNRKSQKFQWPTPRNDTRPTS
ncbi:IS701 family transposase [Cupriavidus necator]